MVIRTGFSLLSRIPHNDITLNAFKNMPTEETAIVKKKSKSGLGENRLLRNWPKRKEAKPLAAKRIINFDHFRFAQTQNAPD